MNLDILYEDNHVIVVVKPANMPVCLDESNDYDLMSAIKDYIKDKYNKPGNVYLGLVHRLDRPVSGVMVFAKTSKAASRLSEEIRLNKMHKRYTAKVMGKLDNEGTFIDYLKKDHNTNTTTVVSKNDKEGKLSKLSYTLLNYDEQSNTSKVLIDLETGRSHQIRVQFSSRKHPLVGDQRYNKNAKKEQINLCATSLTFTHPTTKELMTFETKEPF